MTAPTTATPDAPLSVPANFRDLGGVRTPHGPIRAGVLFRSDDVATATPEFARAMVDQHGIAHVIDLRSGEEVSFTGRGPLASAPVTYHNIPIVDRPVSYRERRPETPVQMGVSYANLTEYAAGRIALAMTLIASADAGVVFHCAAGKDRTGILAALLLTVLGADTAAIVADYARTDAAMPVVNERLAPLIAGVYDQFDATPVPADSPLVRAPAATMSTFLTVMVERHGAVLAPLRAAGLAPETERRLRARLLGTE